MSQVVDGELRNLVFVRPSEPAVSTVRHALREVRDALAERDGPSRLEVHIVVAPDERDAAGRTRTRVEGAIDAFDLPTAVEANVTVLELATDETSARTDEALAAVGGERIGRVLLAPDVDFDVERLRGRSDASSVARTPATVANERRRLLHTGGLRRIVTLFGLTYVFYLAIGGFAGGLDLLTGAMSALVVALALSRVSFTTEPAFGRSGMRIIRLLAFLPVLMWEIVKANFVIAYVILHPSLPIEPSMQEHETATTERLERMVLANSITLTPGTLVVDVRDNEFTVHGLTSGSHEDLAKGRLERLVAWVFHGRPEANGTGDGASDGGDGS